ncbi:MAG TPA: hypothetical protein VHN20_16870, partial [Beijerinckiaceae bacterium]|nr:hypothetical protein [Beijerinckiaceae bacterium]
HLRSTSIPSASPRSVSGNMRGPSTARIICAERVYSQTRGGSGLEGDVVAPRDERVDECRELPRARLDRLALPFLAGAAGARERRGNVAVAGEPPLRIDAAVDRADRPLHVVAVARRGLRCHVPPQMISK